MAKTAQQLKAAPARTKAGRVEAVVEVVVEAVSLEAVVVEVVVAVPLGVASSGVVETISIASSESWLGAKPAPNALSAIGSVRRAACHCYDPGSATSRLRQYTRRTGC